jgi:hypothetical protein
MTTVRTAHGGRTPAPSSAPAPTAVRGTDAAAQLRRLRWAVRATLTLGVAASVAANILHARPNPISQIIAAWPPLALLLTVELISRVPTHRRCLAVIRMAATTVIAGIAGTISYWHMVGVAARYGETEAAAAYLLPVSVDGLVIVASVSLVEITGRIRADDDRCSAAKLSAAVGVTSAPPAAPVAAHGAPPAPAVAAPADVPSRGGDRDDPAHRIRQREDTAEVPSDTAAAVAYWHRRDPHLHPAEIAGRIGRSERTVRRYWPPAATTGKPGVQGKAGPDRAEAL